jgi:DNA polymerase-3 subunit gamma/tau
MVNALYRKWRPTNWDEVVGQDHIIQTLQNAIKGDRIVHAYLFAGPRGTGKTTTARLMAKAVNCLDEDVSTRPCNACSHCLSLNEGSFLDIIEIDAASNTSVEDVRSLREKINFAPNEGRFKVYIIDEVHMLSTAAFNALLKTLEEPPDHAIFILATTEVHKVPATVLSRCQRHEFRRIPVSIITDFLHEKVKQEQIAIEGDVLELIARQATGSLRDAISLLDQLVSTGETVTIVRAQEILGTATSEAVIEVMQAWVQSDAGRGLTGINRALDGGTDPRQFARQIVDYLRGLLLFRMGNDALVESSEEVRELMAAQATSVSLERLLHGIRGFNLAAGLRGISWQSSLPLELAFVETLSIESGEIENPSPATRPTSEVEINKPTTKAEKKTELIAEPAPVNLISGDISFDLILDRWRDILQSARRHDPRAQALMNSCRPLGLDADTLVIGFGSDLLREKMEKGHNISVARDALREILGKEISLRCVLSDVWADGLDNDNQPAPMKDGGMVSTAVRDLGAQVVDVEQLPPDS